ncbi:MAG: hypothetical protein HFG80_02995 [Eubacterium sp.]|nr:hypothetical protein [Eubacterium sp.]
MLRLYKIKLPEELIQKPEAPNRQQKINMVIILVCVLMLFVPAIMQTFFPNPVAACLTKLDITLVYAVGIVLCTLFKIGNEKEVLKKVFRGESLSCSAT